MNGQEPQFSDDLGRCPARLPEEARREWKKVVPDLRAMGLLKTVDRPQLEGYVVNLTRARQADDLIREFGLTFTTEAGYVQMRPEVTISAKCWASARSFAALFGFSPADRTRIKAELPRESQTLDEFLA